MSNHAVFRKEMVPLRALKSKPNNFRTKDLISEAVQKQRGLLG